ncbi:hypothetical protein Chor_015053 [Crotalus horridus]
MTLPDYAKNSCDLVPYWEKFCISNRNPAKCVCVFLLLLEYTDDNALIPKNSSVIVRRIPIGGVKCTSKTYVMIRAFVKSRTDPVSGPSKAVCKNTISHFFLHNLLNLQYCSNKIFL